jgi:uncharacterized protein
MHRTEPPMPAPTDHRERRDDPGAGDDTDELVERLQVQLDAVPAPLEPPDLSALDGFLCGVLLQPHAVPAARWLPFMADVEGHAPPAGTDLRELHALAQQRHATLQRAIARRQWFDPWIAELEPGAPVQQAVLPWVAGFAAAMEQFPEMVGRDDPRLLEPLALLYLHFDADDLDDADALLEVIATLEPPADLAEAAEDLVRAVLLLADVTQPLERSRPVATKVSHAGRTGHAGRSGSPRRRP